MAAILGFLVAGVSWLAHVTHATLYQSGYPSVISQEARAVFGQNTLGTVLFATVQAVSALILYTGANTSFDGFPFWASFAAGDSFLPRQLTKCGHRSSELSLAATGAHWPSRVTPRAAYTDRLAP